MYICHNRASKCMRQKWEELKEERDKTRITVGDVNTWSPIIDKTAKQKISKDVKSLTTVLLTWSNLYKMLNPTIEEYALFFSIHEAFSRPYDRIQKKIFKC